MPGYDLLDSGLLDIEIFDNETPANKMPAQNLTDIEDTPVYVEIEGLPVRIDRAANDLYNLNTYAAVGPWMGHNGVPGEVPSLPDIQELPLRSRYALAKNASSKLLNVPNEILSCIMGHLDLRSASRFSATCSATHETARSYVPFKHLRNHATWACRALVSNGLVASFTLRQMFAVMCSKTCTSCWEPDTLATHVFLPIFERCCLRCLQVNPDYRMITPWVAVNLFTLSLYDLYGNKPAVPYSFVCYDLRRGDARYNTTNGNYMPVTDSNAIPAVSVKQARARSLEIHGKRKRGYGHKNSGKMHIYSKFGYLFGEKSAPCWNNYTKPFVRRGARRNLNGDLVVRNLISTDVPYIRYNAAAPVPNFTPGSGELNHGIWCNACLHKTWTAPIRNVGRKIDHASYTRTQFTDHARSCRYVKRMTSSDSNPLTTAQDKAMRRRIYVQIMCELQALAARRALQRAKKAMREAQARAVKLRKKVEADNMLWGELGKLYQSAAAVLMEDDKAEVQSTREVRRGGRGGGWGRILQRTIVKVNVFFGALRRRV